jgi:endonuclease/exonuclease/phosphatase family metal-dependent hydrolase
VLLVALAYFARERWLAGRDSAIPVGADEYRIASWNAGWLLEDAGEDRCRAMTKVIQELDPDILAVQEVESVEALKKVIPKEYRIAMRDDPLEDQELAVAYRQPFKLLRGPRLLYPESKYDGAFPSRRNALEVSLQNADGINLRLIVVHYKSRSGGRNQTDASRVSASRLLVDYLNKTDTSNTVILGDFNDTPGDPSLNILETGNMFGKGADKFLLNLMEDYYRSDFVTQGVYKKFRGYSIDPVVRGAANDNERLRGKDYIFPRDVLVTQALFDQILISPNLKSKVRRVGIFSSAIAMRGRESRIERDRNGDAIIELNGTLPSDHLPVYADFRSDDRVSSVAPK